MRITEEDFDGTEVNLRVKGVTYFNTPAWKNIRIYDRCPAQTAVVKTAPVTGYQGNTVVD